MQMSLDPEGFKQNVDAGSGKPQTHVPRKVLIWKIWPISTISVDIVTFEVLDFSECITQSKQPRFIV